MKQFARTVLFLLLLAGLPGHPQAQAQVQQLPVSITGFQVTPSVFLSDYVSPGSGNIRLTLKLTDHNEAAVPVYLKWTVEGPNARLVTAPSFRPAEVCTLVPGEPQGMQDADLFSYFQVYNLQCQGITQADLQHSGQLPEGWYTFTVQVLELHSGKALSRPVSTRVSLALIDPPVPVMPAGGQFVKSNVAQLSFNWQQPAHAAIARLDIEYYLRLYEVPDGEEPFAALQSKSAREVSVSPAIRGKAYNYGPADFPLTAGKRYVYTVSAQDAAGRKWFKNGGTSEARWFYFGYPTGGNIRLHYPENEAVLDRKMVQKLEWAASDNIVDHSQPVVYRVKLARLDAGAGPAATLDDTGEWFFESSEIFNKSGCSTVLQHLPSETRHAWQVHAFTEGVETGRSEVRTFYSPPVLEAFVTPYGHVVEVTKITHSALTDLAGEGRVKVSAAGEKVRIHFEHLHVKNADGLMVMAAGEIKCALHGQIAPIALTPSTTVNDRAVCYPDSIRINEEGMYIKGRVEWDYPFGTADSEKSKVRFLPTWFNYNNEYRLSGTPKVVAGQSYHLLEPAQFVMELGDTSYAQVLQNEWEMIFSGRLLVPDNVQGTERARYSIDFSNWHELHYNRMEEYENTNEIRLVAHTQLSAVPRTVVVDLSEEHSPPKFAGMPGWKGVYFEQFAMRYRPDVDDRGQIKLTRETWNDYTLAVADTCRSWITGDGLHFKYAAPVAEEGVVLFNTFPAKTDVLYLDIEKSTVRQAHLKGSIRIPVVSQTDYYAYTVPITNTGIQAGYLDKSLDGLAFVFNEHSADQQLQARIKRAVFAGQNRLDIDLELTWEKIGITFTDLQQFCAWGNYDIGFVRPGGVVNLTHQAQGVVEGYQINAEQMGCSRMCNQYAFAVSASVAIDEDVSGPSGAPMLNFYSIADNSLLHFTDCRMEAQHIETEQKTQNEGNFPMTDAGVGTPSTDYTAEQVAELDARQRAESEAIIATYNRTHAALEDLRLTIAEEQPPYPSTEDYLTLRTPGQERVQTETLSIGEAVELLLTLQTLLHGLDEQAAVAGNSSPKFAAVSEKITYWLAVAQEAGNQVHAIQQLLNDFKSGAILEQVVDVAVDLLLTKLSEPAVKAGESAKAFITAQVGTAQEETLREVEKMQQAFFQTVRSSVAGLSGDTSAVVKIIGAAEADLQKEVRYAIDKSVRENFTAYFTGFVDTVVQVRLVGFVDHEIRSNLKKLVTGEAKNISADELAKNAGNMLSSLGNDVKELIDFRNLSTMMLNTGKDVLNNFRWDKLVSNIVGSVASKGAQQLIAQAGGDLAENLMSGATGDVLSGVMNNVEIDFSALKSGNLKDAIKFDPSHIVIVSKVFEGEGYAKKLQNDPVYGNVFMAHVNATIKVPKPFNAFATFISGKETTGNFDYWFVEFGCRKLGIPMAPVPLVFDGGTGRVYKHMSQASPTAEYVPDANNHFGAGVKAYFYDNTGGSVAAFNVEFTMNIEKEGFRLRMLGDAALGNTVHEGEIKKSIATGYGDMGYSNIDNIFYAKAGVTLHMSPLLCAGGEFNALISPDKWEVSVGTRPHPVHAKLLCRDFLSMESWLMVGNKMLDVGLHQLIDIEARTPRLDLGFIKLDAYAKFRYEFGTELRMFWKPLTIKDAAIYLNMAMSIGIGYDLPWPLGSGDWDIAGVAFGGYLMYRSRTAEEMQALYGTKDQIADYTGNYSVLAGGLHGSVTVIGIKIGLSMDAKKEWKG